MRGYADHREQHLDPWWMRDQLEFSLDQLRTAARSLAGRGLVEFFEWRPDEPSVFPGDIPDGLMPMDLKMTNAGWEYLRNGR
jgi:hypothetical protein